MDRQRLDAVTKTRLKASLDSIADFHNATVRELTASALEGGSGHVAVEDIKGLLNALVVEGQFALNVIEERFATTGDDESYPELPDEEEEEVEERRPRGLPSNDEVREASHLGVRGDE